MKKLIFALFITVSSLAVQAQTNKKVQPAKQIKNQVVEISCGECNFKMKGKSCDLAVRIDGKPYFVDGKKIDEFGDSHSENGFCNAISKAEVTGEIVKGRFKATDIKLLPAQK